jgi:hypothetical protein
MTKTTKIIIGVVVLGALVGGAFYVSKKLKDKREGRGLGADKDKSLLDTSGASSGEYNPRNDSMFGKGLGVLLRPSSSTTTTTTTTKPTTTTTSSTPNFTKGIF